MTMVTSYHTYESYTYISIEGRPPQTNSDSLDKSYREVLVGTWKEVHILHKHSLGRCWQILEGDILDKHSLLTVCFEMK